MGKKKKWSGKNSDKVRVFEKGTVIKTGKELINIALVYPNTYQTGMSNLGFQSVYALFNSNDLIFCHRFFMPDRGRDKNLKLTSCETGIPLSSCDLIAFSVSFENDYINVVSMIKSSGIPPRTSDRDSSYPLIIAGGVACFLNPEPIAPFIDCFLLGESEQMLPAFLDLFVSNTVISHKHLKKEIALNIKGAYIPEFYESFYDTDGNFLKTSPLCDRIPSKIAVQHTTTLDDIVTTTHILTTDTIFSDTFLIETGRGCHHGCRFCSAGFIYRPPRFYPEQSIINSINNAKEITGKIGLVSATVSDHPSINNICASASISDSNSESSDRNIKISFSSLRLDALTDETIETLIKSSVKTATIAPEAGSQRMRNIINKKLNQEQILSAAQRLIEHGIMNLKLYYMVGLPFETDEDVIEIADLTKKIKDVFLEASRKNRKIGTITLSINPFIPKPSTPFQWCKMDTLFNFKRKVDIIRDRLKKVANIVIHIESPKTAMINSILSAGDRRTADMVENPELLDKKIKESKRREQKEDVKNMMCGDALLSEIDFNVPLPWDIIDTGIKKEFLIKELKRAAAEKTSPDCPMLDCSRCGICMEL
ncbi:MAG: radical SAM protein [Desulfamplus sp.]